MWLTLIIQNWKSIALVALIAIAFSVGYSKGEDSIQSQWDKEKVIQQKELLEFATTHAEQIRTLEVTKSENLDKIAALAADNIRLHLPTACTAQIPNPGGSGQTPAGAGTFHVDASEVIEGYTDQVGQLMYEADQVVEQCRVLQGYVQSLNQK